MDSGQRKPGRRHLWRRRLLALGGSTVVTLAVLEIAVRVVVGSPTAERLPILMIEANRYTGFSMVPDQVHHTYLHRTRTNSLGLRSPELGLREPDELRVLVLGDSLIYGQGVGDADTIPALVEKHLRAAGLAANVINGGVRAYATNQMLGQLEELGDAIDPDLVVLTWYWNDFDEGDLARQHQNLSRIGPITFDEGAPVEGWVWWRWQAKQLARASALIMWAHDVVRDARVPPQPEEHFEEGFAKLPGYLDRFEAWCEERGVGFCIFILPAAELALGEHRAGRYQARTEAMARERDIPVVDLTPSIEEAVRELGRLPIIIYDGHYDADGNRALARGLADFLLAPGGPIESIPRPRELGMPREETSSPEGTGRVSHN